MSPADRSLWLAAMRRASQEQPQLALAILRALRVIADTLSEADLTAIIRSGNLDRLVATVLAQSTQDQAFGPVQERLRRATENSFRYFTKTSIPGAGKVNGSLVVRFDYLSPAVVEATQTLETKVITGLSDTVAATLRTAVEQGLKDGVNPRTIARRIPGLIGLGPTQVQEVDNFRRALHGQDGRNPFDYLKRDRRFDATVQRAVSGEQPLSDAQIEKMVDAYRTRRIALNTETAARTATLDAMKAGQHASWQTAIDKGVIGDGQLMRRWTGVMDSRERPEHVAMEGDTVPWGQPHRNGEMVPGESTYNCRCIDAIFVARA